MNEPIYEYTRGRGWHLIEYPIVTFSCGKRARLVPGKPVNLPGTFLVDEDDPKFFHSPGVPNIQALADSWEGWSFSVVMLYTQESIDNRTKRYWFTFEVIT